MSKKTWITVSATGFLVLAVGVVAFLALSPSGKKLTKKITSKIANKPEAYCPIDGLPTTIEKAERKPLGVMVENLASIRPQNGLSKACMVFEALAEGGITRFLAIYEHNDVAKIGPVRSARPYYVALAKGFNALYAHAGGSTQGLQAIKDYGVDDYSYNHMDAYWRQSGIGAPHNLFTSTAKLRDGAEKAGITDTEYTGFEFDLPAGRQGKKLLEGSSAKTVIIKFSSSAYQVEYRYDKSTKRYKRFNGGLPHKDANTGKQITPSNVIVVRADTSMYNALTLNIKIVGEGEGYLFRNGKQAPIKWQKESGVAQISFEDESGEAVKFAPGQIWVEIVGPDTPVEFN